MQNSCTGKFGTRVSPAHRIFIALLFAVAPIVNFLGCSRPLTNMGMAHLPPHAAVPAHPGGLPNAVYLDESGQYALQNPIIVPAADREFVWNQVVDSIDNYFQIAREERIRLVGGVLTAGRIETRPEVGATIFEPWKRDSTRGFERLHSTLQSIRRRAEVRVMPVSEGYSVEVIVLKELEDLSRPERATVGGSTLRHDGSLVRSEPGPENDPPVLGWIPLGRDVSLEREILDDIHARLADVPSDGTFAVPSFGP